MNNRFPKLLLLVLLFLIFHGCAAGPDSFKDGLDKYKSGDYSGSILEYDKEILNHDDNDSVYLMKGKAESLLGKYENAINDFTK